MAISVFSSRSPIANLATSDVLNQLIAFGLRRIAASSSDPILPMVVECVSSVGVHLYYADQVQDMAEEIIGKLVSVQMGGRALQRDNQQEALRFLLACLSGLLSRAADSGEGSSHDVSLTRVQRPANGPSSTADAHRASVPSLGGRRNPIAPETWLDTLALLCEANFSVRSSYARLLPVYIRSEIRKEPGWADESELANHGVGSKPAVDVRDETTRFFQAMSAALFMLAFSPAVGIAVQTASAAKPLVQELVAHVESSLSESPAQDEAAEETKGDLLQEGQDVTAPTFNFIAATPVPTPRPQEAEVAGPILDSASTPTRKTSTGNLSSANTDARRSMSLRKQSAPLSLIQSSVTGFSSPAISPATPNDYSHFVAIVSSAVRRSPARALLTTVPMLLAADRACAQNLSEADRINIARRHALREALGQIWAVIGSIIESPEIIELAEQALSSITKPSSLPSAIEQVSGDLLSPPEQSLEFETEQLGGALPAGGAPLLVDPEKVLTVLSSHQRLRQVTQMDRQGLLKRLAVEWSINGALTDSFETSSAENGKLSERSTPFLKLAPALMHLDNKSLASVSRRDRNIGVGDLRDALEGRTNRSSTAFSHLGSTSSLGHYTVAAGLKEEDAKKRFRESVSKAANGEVKEILSKLGIGKNAAGERKSVFKTPFPPKRKESGASGIST